MSEYDKCSHLAILPRLIAAEEPFPNDFVTHARNCDVCLFWTSYALAIQKTCCTTDRLTKDKECLPAQRLAELLTIAARGLRTFPLLNKKTAKSMQHVAAGEELLQCVEIRSHLNECRFCRDYYDALYENMIKFQEQFENAIKNGEEIRPYHRIDAREINAEAAGLNPYDENRRPN